PPEQWHMTLRFLGECPEHRIPAITRAMRRTADETSSFAASFTKPGTFSGPRMGVLWLGVESEGDALKLLAERLNQNLEKEGFLADPRPFRGHLTLARSRRKIPTAVLRNLSTNTGLSMRMDQLHLYQSTINPRGSR